MKTFKNKIYRHVLGFTLMIVIGVMLPIVFQLKYFSYIQILLVTTLVCTYVALVYENIISTNNQVSQSHIHNRMVESQKIMLELSNYMIQVKSVKELLSIILEKAIEMIPTASHGSILVMNKKGKLEFKAIFGFEEDLFKVMLDPEESYQWKAANGVFTGPIIIEDLQKYGDKSLSEDNYNAMNEIEALSINSSLSAPIMINKLFFGFINLDSKMNNMFNEEDIQMMAYFANQATIAIANHQLYEEVLYFSRYDGLTKIFNRRYFEEIIQEQLLENLSIGFSIVIIDLNKFKQINDLYGHRNGDLVLESFATFFREEVSDKDVFARYGGDEFVSMFYNKSYAQTDEMMLKIQQLNTIRKIELLDTVTSIEASFSYGIATYPNDGINLNQLLFIADSRMYEYKKSLHNRIYND